MALGEGAQVATAPDVGAPGRGGDEVAVDPELPAQVDALRDAGEEGVGRLVEHPAVEGGGPQLPAGVARLDELIGPKS